MKRITCILLVLMLIFLLTSCKDSKQVDNEGFVADDYYLKLEKCVEQIRKKTSFVPDIVLVLGSGLGGYVDDKSIIAEIPYSDIDGFPISTVNGHEGTLIFCEIKGKNVAIMNGRVHYYESGNIHEVVVPLRVLHMLGAKTVILTNAAGAINTNYSVGDYVLNVDHISSFVPSPLVGENIDRLGERFIDMSAAYDQDYISIVENVAKENNITIRRGVLLQTTGPQYETPAEIKMYQILGADTVGMSTVVETIAARHMGMRVCSISIITNMAAGIQEKISHDEVKEISSNSQKSFSVLIDGLIAEI